MTCASIYTSQLRSRGFRMTPQRMAILHVLHQAGTHLSPGDIYTRARRELPGLTEPTVYRTLDFLVENGLVHPSQSGGGHLTYEIAGRDHHHLVCRICGGEIEVEHSLLASLYRRLEKSTGYQKILQACIAGWKNPPATRRSTAM